MLDATRQPARLRADVIDPAQGDGRPKSEKGGLFMEKVLFVSLRRAYRLRARNALAEYRRLDPFCPSDEALQAGNELTAIVWGFAARCGCSARVAADCLGLE